MNLQIRFREAWQSTAHKLLLEVEQWVTTINRAWRAQHADDGTHGAVTAETVVADVGMRAGGNDATGYVRLVRGTNVRPGYIDWSLPDGTRIGYMGWDITDVELFLLNGAMFSVVGGAVQLAEMTEPAAPAANRARLYVKDNGAGKTQLCVRFATGAVQVIATEP